MAALDSQHAVADPDDPVGSALGKILRVLPTNVARQAVMLRETARSVPERVVGQAGPGRDDASWSPRVRRAAAGAPGLPHGGGQPAHLRGGPVVGGGALRPVVPAVPLAPCRRAADLPHRPGHRGRVLDGHLRAAGGPRPGRRARGQPRQGLGARDARRRSTPRSTRCGRGSGPPSATCARCRTGGASWSAAPATREAYAGEWLAGIPLPFTVVGGEELRAAVAWWRRGSPLGQRLTATSLPRLQPGEIGR